MLKNTVLFHEQKYATGILTMIAFRIIWKTNVPDVYHDQNVMCTQPETRIKELWPTVALNVKKERQLTGRLYKCYANSWRYSNETHYNVNQRTWKQNGKKSHSLYSDKEERPASLNFNKKWASVQGTAKEYQLQNG